jgi:calcineurin-like phosphoesterase family protein
MIYFTSDTHFCHDRAFIWQPRGFATVEEMNKAIIDRWNKIVQPEDTVYHLGDCILNDNAAGMECMKALNGNIKILRGNHDTNSRVSLYQKEGFEVLGYADVLEYKKYKFYLSHYPTLTSNLDNEAPLKMHILNLFGHTHQKDNFYEDIPFMYHVGLDSHNCTPVSIEEILEDIKKEVAKCKEQL